jgi:hypothetical protein
LNGDKNLEGFFVRIKGLVLIGVMIIVSLIYFFFGGFKGAKVNEKLTVEGKAVSAEKK